jgi:hypothetical protein
MRLYEVHSLETRRVSEGGQSLTLWAGLPIRLLSQPATTFWNGRETVPERCCTPKDFRLTAKKTLRITALSI